MRIAAITMCWNERLFLPMWRHYYGRQLGFENLFIIDNDSDDGSTSDVEPASRIRYPRTSFDDAERALFVTNIANALRTSYDVIIVTDCDEFIVPDPALFVSLPDCIASIPGEVIAPIGLNVHHILTVEAPYDPQRPLFDQRRHARYVSPMCKPSISRVPVRYKPGFHNTETHPTFAAGLFNFHLRWVDCGYALQRLSMTRAMAWRDARHWHYQRQSDEDTLSQFLHMAKFERRADDKFGFSERISSLRQSVDGGRADIPQDLRDDFLTVVPERFVGVL